ncbi:hypothetical protein BBP40_009073 [Aspergillus hancockii]|nr:hypothetical protein BBP40_009073 [Aspergillus hancockii]
MLMFTIFLIQDDGTLAVADFGGSRIDDTPAVVSDATRYTRPCAITEDDDSTEVDDLFAPRAPIYEIITGHRLFSDKTSQGIRMLIHRHELPDLAGISEHIHLVIRKRWTSQYPTAREVAQDRNTTSPPVVS